MSCCKNKCSDGKSLSGCADQSLGVVGSQTSASTKLEKQLQKLLQIGVKQKVLGFLVSEVVTELFPCS